MKFPIPEIVAAIALLLPANPLPAAPAKPNFVIIFCDDMGYGDLACYGHEKIKTPHLDRMAAEGQRWTDFYAAAPVCTPSRTAILTGRLPVRSGMCSAKTRVLFPDSLGGLPPSEITLARALKDLGYDTMAIGKWHLGHLPPHLPTSHGFDHYFGIPYSNDMDKVGKGDHIELAEAGNHQAYNVPLMRDAEIIERPANQHTITRRYAEEAARFLRAREPDRPFFLYLAHNMPHVPLFRDAPFAGKSAAGFYGDVIEEIDWSVGQVLAALKDRGLDRNTLVFFSSDNGPWLIFKHHGGSAGPLRDGKGCTFDGGMRVPGIFRWTGAIRPAVVRDIGSTLDIFPTFLALAGGRLPTDRPYDGFDLRRTLLEGEPSPRQDMPFYRDDTLYAWRHGDFKAHFATQGAYGADAKNRQAHDPPLLHNLRDDIAEQTDIGANHPDILAKIRALADAHRASVQPVENQLEKRARKKTQ
ncbi:MAG: sulfatase [Verrucomicrobiae bacterium]|nr:sulfatase [Verrucomicrobiae bacterium]